jgi:hypothetical protein
MATPEFGFYFLSIQIPDDEYFYVEKLFADDDEKAKVDFRDRASEILSFAPDVSKRIFFTLYSLPESGFRGEDTDDLIELDEFVHEAVNTVSAMHDHVH